MKKIILNSDTYTKLTYQSDTVQVYFNSDGYTYMYATCFGLYLGHPQARQHKNRNRKMQQGSTGFIFYSHYFYNIKTQKIYNMKL